MIQGEPLETTTETSTDSADSASVGPVMQVPDRSADKTGGDDALSIAMGLSTEDDSLDSEVEELVEALAEVEQERDEDWIEAAQTDLETAFALPADSIADEHEDDKSDEVHDPAPEDDIVPDAIRDDGDAEIDEANDGDEPIILGAPDDAGEEAEIEEMTEFDTVFAMPAVIAEPDTSDSVDDEQPDASEAADELEEAPDETPIAFDTEIADEAGSGEAEAGEAPRQDAPGQDPSPNLLGLQAINVLNEKISSSEERYDDALAKIGHALGVIAERIDGLDGRMTNQAIAGVAMAAAPSPAPLASLPPESSEPQPSDDNVAPYIAQAERELKARKESGPMDIFDRIAKAAETEFDDQSASTETRIIENSSDGRRVGTKRWQPSKTVKRRMEQLEKAKNGEVTGDPSIDIMPEEPRSLRADVEEITSGVNAPRSATKDSASAKAKPMLDLDDEFEEDDDAGLSVVPGARGRRKNRARKSRLDEDFENVFEETEGKPSIQSLRRKMRDRPAEEAPEEAAGAAKNGMLGGLLGKKGAKKAAPVAAIEDDEDDLMAAFEAPEEAAPKKRKKAKAKPAPVMEDEDDWGDEETSTGISFAGGPLLYVLIAGAAGAAFFAWQQNWLAAFF